MNGSEYWPPAVISRSLEKLAFSKKPECSFEISKNKQIILIPGMGAPVSQLFELVNALRNENAFTEYGVTSVELGLSLGDFSLTLENLTQKIERELLSRLVVKQIVLYAHSHGGRFASELATYLQTKYPNLELIVITGGTPIQDRPRSLRNWLFSLSFRQWPQISQPQLEMFFALYSIDDVVVDTLRATAGSEAKLIELAEFSHDDFRQPVKIVPELKKLLGMASK